MSDFIFFDSKILNNIFLNKVIDYKEFTFLLLSVNDKDVFWIIKIEDDFISDDYLNLLKFIIPFGVKIIGLFYFGKKQELNTFINLAFTSYYQIKKLYESNYHSILTDFFYSIIIEDIKNLNLNEILCDGNILKIKDNNLLEKSENLNKIKFVNFEDEFNKNFIIIKTFVNPVVIINSNNFIMNELFNSNYGIYYPEMNILIENLSDIENLSNKENKEYVNIIEENRIKINKLIVKY